MRYNMRNWLLCWLTFAVVLTIVHDPWQRLVSFSSILLVVALYHYLFHHKFDRFLLSSALGIAALAILTYIQRGLPFFVLTAIVFIGVVIAPIYSTLRHPNPAAETLL